jgi:hypothetical protein
MLEERYAPYLDDYCDSETAAELHHADPHDKRELRIQAWMMLKLEGETNSDRWSYSKVMAKMKKDEIAQAGLDRYPRMIMDLGVAASLRGFVLTKYLKRAQEFEVVHINGGHIQFISKPRASVLATTFAKLMNPPGRFYACIFSDDACISIRTPNGEVHMYNSDIKTCDASHTPELFDALHHITPSVGKTDMTYLINQCKAPIQIQSKSGRKEHRVLLQSKDPILLTGSTLTTLINNLANFVIMKSFTDQPYFGEASLHTAAANCGYIVTLERCLHYSDLQFLKHSPVFDTNGNVQPLLNIGVLLRLTGTCKGDLPGRGPLRPRANAFQAGLLQGAYPRVSFPLIDNMKRACKLHSNTLSTKQQAHLDAKLGRTLAYKVDHEDDYPPFEVSTEEVFQRYDLTAEEQIDVTDVFGNLTYSQFYASRALSKILETDYGLHCKYTVSHEYPLPSNRV